MGAFYLGIATQGQIQLLTVFAHPADLPGRYADHQGVSRYVLVDHCACTDKCELTDGDATDDGAVGAKCCPLLDDCIAILVFAFNQGARVIHVGEYHAWPTEYALFQVHVIVDRYVVLDLAVIANRNLVTDKDILAKRYALADACAATDMDKMPDTGTVTNYGPLIDYG